MGNTALHCYEHRVEGRFINYATKEMNGVHSKKKWRRKVTLSIWKKLGQVVESSIYRVSQKKVGSQKTWP